MRIVGAIGVRSRIRLHVGGCPCAAAEPLACEAGRPLLRVLPRALRAAKHQAAAPSRRQRELRQLNHCTCINGDRLTCTRCSQSWHMACGNRAAVHHENLGRAQTGELRAAHLGVQLGCSIRRRRCEGEPNAAAAQNVAGEQVPRSKARSGSRGEVCSARPQGNPG